ncbi:MAG: hypothetical protein GY927_17480, partial [bacterium]|nr:hypothetical protein [bacterium]
QQQPQTVEPKIEDYESAAEWQRDFVTFTNSKAESIANKAIETRLQSMETERSQAQIDTSFNTSMDAAAEKHEDFWDVVTDPRATFMNGPLLETVKQMPNAGELAYHINSNPAEGHKLAAMNATQMAAELGRLDATLNSQKPESKPNLTNAPDPPSNISGAPVAEVDLNKVGVDDYMRLRREQLKKRRGY